MLITPFVRSLAEQSNSSSPSSWACSTGSVFSNFSAFIVRSVPSSFLKCTKKINLKSAIKFITFCYMYIPDLYGNENWLIFIIRYITWLLHYIVINNIQCQFNLSNRYLFEQNWNNLKEISFYSYFYYKLNNSMKHYNRNFTRDDKINSLSVFKSFWNHLIIEQIVTRVVAPVVDHPLVVGHFCRNLLKNKIFIY